MKKLEILRNDKDNVIVSDNVGKVQLAINGFPHMITTLDFYETLRLYWWIRDWIYERVESGNTDSREIREN